MTDLLADHMESRQAQEQWLQDNIDRAEWRRSPGYDGLLEYYIDSVLLAWINPRPHYCDRGHYQAQLEFSPGNPFDEADGMPCYYMNLPVAKLEVKAKLLWRVCKVRIQYPYFERDGE